ncbi:hypothetical protein TESG_03605 [Trichophyton tonsurans CBS 112818]|uniref:Large ribosomal subunit protein mL54 n=1 Tax=Trichophyton tonsurans (strain CBS 112818) TaxID=647933 RepID=F2RXV2_TRIT1|nr:hypothetical protein TESG_03605 [Trichophyton tonsurans CBS 112818]
MICRQCRSSLLSRLPSRPASAAYSYSHIPSRQPHRFYSAEAPAAPAADAASPAPLKTATKAAPKIVSSVPAGTKLAGLNYEKNKQDPIALEDHEYPDWLWTLLDKTAKKSETGAGSVDVSNGFERGDV